MLEDILKREDVKDFLNEVLLDERYSKSLATSNLKEIDNIPNQYSLLIVMDAIMKFSILFNDEDLIENFLLQLRRMLKKIDNYKSLVYGIYKLFASMTAKKLDLNNIDSPENKKKILEYTYNNYIVNGYCFHAFPYNYKDIVIEQGIDPLNYSYDVNDLKQINNMFNNHNFKNVITKDLDEIDHYITITDSGAMAYFYAFASPKYFSDLCATSKYMSDNKKYDNSAFYKKDFTTCRKNLMTLCREADMSSNESYLVINNLIKEWKRLDIDNAKPTIAFIKRNAVGRDFLKDYRQILDTSKKIDIVDSMAKILDSRNNSDKRYTPLSKEEIKVEIFPSYRDVYYNEEIFYKEESNEININNINIEEELPIISSNKGIVFNAVNNYGRATFFFLLGTLFITLGLTVAVLIGIYR